MRATLINILIVFFAFLLFYQIFLDYEFSTSYLIEGMDTGASSYKPYDTNNPNNAMILAQQNAGNIAYLKERMDKYESLYSEVQDISGKVQNLQDQVNQMVQAQQEYTNNMTGSGSPPQITGA